MTTIKDLLEALGGRLLAGGATLDAAVVPLGSVATDSRLTEQGNIFWALRGSNYDGNNFANEAFQHGAAGAVVSRDIEVPEGRWAVVVSDTQQALLDWATWNRRRFTGTLIAVTGSVGKTTTRQMIHTVLQARLSGTASPRNFNNHLSVPLSMLAIEPCHDYAVLELAAGQSGEIAALAALCRPKVAVITQIGDAHLGGAGNRQGMAAAKAELLAALPADGRAVLGEDPWLRSVAAGCRADITWVGNGPECDLRAVDVTSAHGKVTFRVAMAKKSHEPSLRLDEAGSENAVETVSRLRFSVPVWGQHHATSALMAVAVGRMMGFDLEDIAATLEKFEPVPMRCEVRDIRGATIINDAYNASPTAMLAALDLVREFDAPGRRIVVCGDMGDLGDRAVALHWQLGKEIVNRGGAELVIACGEYSRHVTAGARAAGLVRTRAIPCDTIEDAMPFLGQAILPGDVVLVKGSRIMGMERVVEALEQYPKRRSA
jgi:UDP-N-acetylmuramoyl-tripeptide--D-alanyl-D-alanine ligase